MNARPPQTHSQRSTLEDGTLADTFWKTSKMSCPNSQGCRMAGAAGAMRATSSTRMRPPPARQLRTGRDRANSAQPGPGSQPRGPSPGHTCHPCQTGLQDPRAAALGTAPAKNTMQQVGAYSGSTPGHGGLPHLSGTARCLVAVCAQGGSPRRCSQRIKLNRAVQGAGACKPPFEQGPSFCVERLVFVK